MGLRTFLVSDAKFSTMDFGWIMILVFVGAFLLALLNGYLKSVQETTIIQVQTPRFAGSVSDSPYSIHINITHRMHIPEMRLPPAAVTAGIADPTETKKTL